MGSRLPRAGAIALRPLLATLMLAALVPPALAVNNYTALWDSSVEGWTPTTGTATLSIVSQALRVHPLTNDPQAISPTLNFTATAHDYMRIEIRSASSSNAFQIFYRTSTLAYAGSRSKTYTISTDGAFHYYTIPLSGSYPGNSQLAAIPGWSTAGNILQVRLDPTSATGADVDLSFIAIRTDDKAPDPPVVDALSPGTYTTGPITVNVHGDDPPPVGVPGNVNPDFYASGVYDFGWSVDGSAVTWVTNNGFNAISGRATGVLTVPTTGLSAGCHTLTIQSRDRCGFTSSATTRTIYVGNGFRITGRSTSFETGLPVAGDVITWGTECTGGPSGQLTTDANGFYQTPLLPVGNYSVGAGSCPDVSHQCQFGNPIVIGCGGDQVANFRQKGLVEVSGMSATPQADGHSIRLTWDPGNLSTDRFRVLVSTSPSGPFTPLVETNPPYVHSGVACGVTQYYEVSPMNACNRVGQPSPVFSATIPCPIVQGYVEDATTHLAVPGATLTLFSGSQPAGSTTAGPDGTYSLTATTDGALTLQTVQADGYWPNTESIALAAYQALDHAVSLIPVDAPTNVQSATEEADNSVLVTWHATAPETKSYELFRKVSALSDETYAFLASVNAPDTTFIDHPTDGLEHSYRVRAVLQSASGPGLSARPAIVLPLVTFRSGFSSFTKPPAVGGFSSTPLPKRVVVKNYGDSQALVVHISPPEPGITFAGIQSANIIVFEQSTCGNISPQPAGVVSQAIPNGLQGDFVVRIGGFDPNKHYWFAVTLTGPKGTSSVRMAQCEGIQPHRPPIVLVHGFRGSADELFTYWETMAIEVGASQVDRISFFCNWANWKDWAPGLKTQITKRLSADGKWPFEERVDIVAHSQGGLASREFIENKGGAALVRALVMVGTPSHGAQFAELIPRLIAAPGANVPCFGGIGGLVPNNQDLNVLNFGAPNAGDASCANGPQENPWPALQGITRYYMIAGTGANFTNTYHENLAAIYATIRKSTCLADGVVPARSVRLRRLVGTPQSFQWLDTDLMGNRTAYNIPRLAHDRTTRNWCTKGSKAMLDSYELAGYVAHVLLAPTLPAKSALPAQSLGTFAAPMPALEEPPPPTEDTTAIVESFTDSLATNAPKTHQASVDSCTAVAVMVNTDGWLPRLTLHSPQGTTFTVDDTSTVAGVSYESDDSGTVALLRVTHPSAGTWSVDVAGPDTSITLHYSGVWAVERSPYGIVASVTPEVPAPGDTALLQCTLSRAQIPVAASVHAVVSTPEGGSQDVELRDDAESGDPNPGDGTYVAKYLVPSIDGVFGASFTAASLPATGTPTVRSQTVAFPVSFSPDAEVDSLGISADPALAAAGQLVTLRAIIRNVGSAAGSDFEVAFRDSSTAESLGVAHVVVAAGDSAIATISWTPTGRGEHRIAVDVESVGETDPFSGNNTAHIAVPVTGTAPVLDVPVPPSGIKAFALEPPFPNPFANSVSVRFLVPQRAQIEIDVFDVQGRRVRRLANETFDSGIHLVQWDGSDSRGGRQSSGIYYVRMTAPGMKFTRRMVYIR